MIERILRTAADFREVEECDRRDIARLSLEERISAVEKLRRIWFGENPAKSRLERVLVVRDLKVANKRASGRDRDLRDVAMLQDLSSPSSRQTARHRRASKPRS